MAAVQRAMFDADDFQGFGQRIGQILDPFLAPEVQPIGKTLARRVDRDDRELFGEDGKWTSSKTSLETGEACSNTMAGPCPARR